MSELIVCDNNSTDRTAEIARAAGAKVVFEPVNQIARARNAGAAAASGDWLVFVDADSYPTRRAVPRSGEAMQERLPRRRRHGALRDARPPIRAWSIGAVEPAQPRGALGAPASFIFCEAAAFRELGGFSQELYAVEEIDLFARLKRRARRDGREIVILHRHPLRTSDRKAQPLHHARVSSASC